MTKGSNDKDKSRSLAALGMTSRRESEKSERGKDGRMEGGRRKKEKEKALTQSALSSEYGEHGDSYFEL
jgi:hypothetical protein